MPEITITVNDAEIVEMVTKMIAKDIAAQYTAESRDTKYGIRKGVESAVKEYIYANKDVIIEKCEEAIAAWNRRAQPENEPLTEKDLREMENVSDGTPIWIEPTDKYTGEWSAAWYIWPYDSKDFKLNTYAVKWLAYRTKPEGSAE